MLAIAATFTAEPLADPLAFWTEELGLPHQAAFAPYGQVFQELLEPSSLLRSNPSGVSVVLVRLEDWDTPGTASPLEEHLTSLAVAVEEAARHCAAGLLVCVCPASPSVTANPERCDHYARLEHQLAAQLDGVQGVRVVTSEELSSRYPVAAGDDPDADAFAHAPYTGPRYAAIATQLARHLHALEAPPYKVVAVDCDGTLWRGVCGEDGPLGVEVDAPCRALQEMLVRVQQAGMLLCLCSRSSEADVQEVLARQPSMPLTLDRITSRRLGIASKSEALRSLSTELGLALDTFVFIDDDPFECAEVAERCPEALTIELPREASRIPHLLEHVWAFDPRPATREARSRTELQRQQSEREVLRSRAPSLEEFLDALQLEVRLVPMAAEHAGRVLELGFRTTQLNVTMARHPEAELRRLCASGALEGLVVEVRDRFGDYGRVGAMLFVQQGEALRMDTFLLSCRALGRRVEQRMLDGLVALASERGLARIELPYVRTARNGPALAFLQAIPGMRSEPTSTGLLFTVDVRSAQSPLTGAADAVA